MRVSLIWKAVLGLLAIALAPLLASVLLVEQVARVAESVAVGEAERLHAAADRARNAYAEAFDARKTAFLRSADAVATHPALATACARGEAPPLTVELDRDPALGAIAFHAPGRRAVVATRPTDAKALTLEVARALPSRPACVVALTYRTEKGARLSQDYVALGETLAAHRQLERIRERLPPSYQLVFVLVVGGFALATTAIAIFFARRSTSRIDRLVAATRRVTEGDLETRISDRGRDELADLAHAFDEMVAELAHSRAEIDYLQKIGAWQEVAQRLAHEIKNPLTPIQLAVQELHKQYAGDDPRFRRMLDDARDIVAEEIAGLRRLVDAFSAFAKLPRVEPRPLDLAVVVDDGVRDTAESSLVVELDAPPLPATVAGDRLLLRRALVNLLENAAQAGARKARVAWRHEGATARMTVEDDGPGIPAELRARVFDPYVTAKPHGTGLGLAIVKKTVLEHGGSIALATSTLGGAAFSIVLPIAAPAP